MWVLLKAHNGICMLFLVLRSHYFFMIWKSREGTSGQGLNWAGRYPFLSLPVLIYKVGVTCLLQKVVVRTKSSDAQSALVPPLAAAREWSHVTESFPRSTRVLLASRGSLFCTHVDLYGRVRTHDDMEVRRCVCGRRCCAPTSLSLWRRAAADGRPMCPAGCRWLTSVQSVNTNPYTSDVCTYSEAPITLGSGGKVWESYGVFW